MDQQYLAEKQHGFKGEFWITIYHTASPLLMSRLKDAGCVVYRGDGDYFHRVYALFEDGTKMDWINDRHYRSVLMILGSYKGYQKWLEDGHHTKVEL